MKKLTVFAILAVIALAILNLTYQDGIEPDAVYPMADQRIAWNQGK